MTDKNVNGLSYLGCDLRLDADDAFSGMRAEFRVSACNAHGVCGNYQRHALDIDTSGLEELSVDMAPACLEVPARVESGLGIEVKWCPAPAQNKVASYQLVGELKDVLLTSAPAELATGIDGKFTVNRPALPQGRNIAIRSGRFLQTAWQPLIPKPYVPREGSWCFQSRQSFLFSSRLSKISTIVCSGPQSVITMSVRPAMSLS